MLWCRTGNVQALSKLGLPPINLEAGPQGVADQLKNVTGWPSQLTVAMAWSPSLMEEWGAAMGKEQKLKGTNVMLGPDVNLARVPWSGRVFETNGEDPFLSAALVRSEIKGIQSNNISACVKHYIFNNHECNRETYSANVPERVGRELYAPGFLAAVDAGVGSVMCAFNRVNDTFSCQNHGALQSLLKDDGGFRGWVVTDWGAQHDLIPSANGGLDQEMEWVENANHTRYGQPGFANAEFLAALQNGSIPMSRLDDMATRILTPMYALGLVDDPPKAAQTTAAVTRSTERDALALKLSEQSIALLKNEASLLPFLPKQLHEPVLSTRTAKPEFRQKTIIVFGDEASVAGHGSGGVVMPTVTLVSTELAKLFPASEVRVSHSATTDPEAAAALAESADLAVVVVRTITGEGMDRTNLTLSGSKENPVGPDQDKLVAAIAAKAGSKTCVLARVSGAFAMPWLDNVAAVLYQLMPGQAAGIAAAKAITGQINPQGKLPVSFPPSIDDTWLGTPLNPAQYPGVTKSQEKAALNRGSARGSSNVSKITCINPQSDTAEWQRCDYSIEGLHVGYRWHATAEGKQHPPVFPFGHGLSKLVSQLATGILRARPSCPLAWHKPWSDYSGARVSMRTRAGYTTFAYSDLKASPSSVTFKLANTGMVEGTETSQLYLRFPDAADEPPLQLKGFAKTTLAPGTHATVTIQLTSAELSVWSVSQHRWVVVPGDFGVMVGGSSADLPLKGTMNVPASP